MAYDEGLGQLIREVSAADYDFSEKKMFGGIAFMLNGYMCTGIVGDVLMVRVGPDAYAAAVAEVNVRPMDFTGRPMKGYVYIDPQGIESDSDLVAWISRAVDYVLTLPPKKK